MASLEIPPQIQASIERIAAVDQATAERMRQLQEETLTKTLARVAECAAQAGGLDKWLAANSPLVAEAMGKAGVRIADLPLDEAAALWPSWSKAHNRLQKCQGCDGPGVDYWHHDQPHLASCEYPLFRQDGSADWVSCPKRPAKAAHERFLRLLGLSHLPRRFADRRLDALDASGDPCLAKALAAARAFAEGFGKDGGAVPDRGLLLLGPAGTGKTHLAAGVVLAVLERGVSAAFYTAPDLLGELRLAISEDRLEKTIRDLERVPLLVLDDLAKEHIPSGGAGGGYTTSSWAQESLYRIINARYEDLRPLLVTTNLPEDQLVQRYGPALVSRFHEMLDWHVLDVPDYRRREARRPA